MGYTIYDAANAYLNKIKSALAVNAKTTLLHNEDNFMYEKRGGATLVRSADAGYGGIYNKDNGFKSDYGTGDGLTWESYLPQHDIAKVIRVDKKDELASYLAGMDSSIGAMVANYAKNYLADQFDATNIASLYAKIPAANVIETGKDGGIITATGVLDTLNALESAMFSAGSTEVAVFFVERSVYDALKSAVLATAGAVAFISRVRDVRVETGFEELLGMEAPATITTEVIKWNQHYIAPMPAKRMFSDIKVLDGQSADEKAGGYATTAASRQIRILAIPLESGFVSVRYEVNNLLLPGDMSGFSLSASDVTKSIDKLREGNSNGMFSNLTIQNVMPNTYFDAFEFHNRTIYGADLFKSRAKTAFAVADKAAA